LFAVSNQSDNVRVEQSRNVRVKKVEWWKGRVYQNQYHHSTMKYFTMSEKEIEHYEIIKRSLERELIVKEAAELTNLSERHVYRLRNGVKKKGPQGLIHGNRGRESNNKVPEKERRKIVDFFKDENHQDFGPTFATEKLGEIGIQHSSETIRGIMIEEEIWKPKKRKTCDYRSRRERKGHYGEMTQFDGSYHDWFEKGEEDCLLAGIDDATSTITHAQFAEGENENLPDVFSFFNEYFLSIGKPKSIYLDKLSTYYNNLMENKKENLTQFQRAMEELDIEPIPAHSPQAKGRVERLFNTLQDRLIKEMRLKGISSKKEANEYLREEFIPSFNKKYGKKPREKGNFHRKVNEKEDSSKDSFETGYKGCSK